MEKGSKEYRNEYNRYVLLFLIDNYYISRIELSKAIGLASSYVREFSNGTRSFGTEALDRFEELVFNKYEPLLDENSFELEQVEKMILELNTSEEVELFRLKGSNALDID
ncbi:XRE family transcriptional regulator [Carnobacterium divergens]|uniref:XRE family transcriptional regulator n=1 Tax=Carnobacterium divergens TaxID=2748 RepID=A0AAW8RAX5_CARDV|nr:XRE family transcriptional regulator [Carnobacterium divergens]MDT1958948.1 XRE family transcriptional regulator [Carnobacterium divergens]MDT1974916.1 XRE family transcriptional regulator [Carnobacterium divergens]MDT2012880.1 XRE family transcriptional regulator [Carnobacterium divergens]